MPDTERPRTRGTAGSQHPGQRRAGKPHAVSVSPGRRRTRSFGADVQLHPAVARRAPRAVQRCGIFVVDGNNVIGTVADGWWRDRPVAVRRLLSRMQCFGEPAILVLDVAQGDLPEGDHSAITVRYATWRGRDAADDLIRELVGDIHDATVVTSDRALRHDVEAAGFIVIGARTYLARLDAAGC